MPLPTTVGRYTIAGTLAHGGTAELLLGIEPRRRRWVAIKWLSPQWAAHAAMVQQLEHEARVLSALRHPNVVRAVGTGVADARRFVALEYLSGHTVSALMFEATDACLAIPPQVAVTIARDAAAGLHAAHSLADRRGQPIGLVHRDVSPRNLFVTASGVTRVIDFGIATSRISPADIDPRLIAGTPGYRAPEQARSPHVDHTADIYGLGAVLYELLTGVRPAESGPLPRPRALAPSIGPALDRVVMRALAPSPAHRPRTAAQLRDELGHAASRDGIVPDRTSVAALATAVDRASRSGRPVSWDPGEATLTDTATYT